MKTRLAVALLAGLVGIFIIGGCGPTVMAKYDAGVSLQNRQDYVPAIEMYQEYATECPDSTMVPYALIRIARCYVELGDKPNAVAAYKKVGEQFPTSEVARWAEVELRELENKDLVPVAPMEESMGD